MDLKDQMKRYRYVVVCPCGNMVGSHGETIWRHIETGLFFCYKGNDTDFARVGGIIVDQALTGNWEGTL